jgi:hypothetical protein
MRAKTFGSSPSGRYSAGGTSAATSASSATGRPKAAPAATRVDASSRSTCASSHTCRRPSRRSAALPEKPSRAIVAGTTEMATAIEAMIAAEIAIAMSEKSWPASCSTNRIGANTITVVSVEASTAGQTSRTPAIVACSRRHARAAQPLDVLEHHDGVVHRHADREGDAGERDHVDGPPEHQQAEEGRQRAERDASTPTKVACPSAGTGT